MYYETCINRDMYQERIYVTRDIIYVLRDIMYVPRDIYVCITRHISIETCMERRCIKRHYLCIRRHMYQEALFMYSETHIKKHTSIEMY